jgi:hypothetical protein
MKKLDKLDLRGRREFLRKAVKRTLIPVLVAHSLKNMKADPLYGESRQNEVL